MHREYHKWWSNDLGRDMEMLVFGRDGLPAIVFPTSCGRFFEFEDRGMVGAPLLTSSRPAACSFSASIPSTPKAGTTPASAPTGAPPATSPTKTTSSATSLPLVRQRNHQPHLAAVGCSFGGFHAVNIALRHPHLFTGALSMSGAFDLRGLGFLGGRSDDNAYFNLPLDYVPNIHDHAYLEALRRNTWVLATGVHDQCWNDNERLAHVLRDKGIPVRLDVWGDAAGHDWPWWQRMAHVYL